MRIFKVLTQFFLRLTWILNGLTIRIGKNTLLKFLWEECYILVWEKDFTNDLNRTLRCNDWVWQSWRCGLSTFPVFVSMSRAAKSHSVHQNSNIPFNYITIVLVMWPKSSLLATGAQTPCWWLPCGCQDTKDCKNCLLVKGNLSVPGGNFSCDVRLVLVY